MSHQDAQAKQTDERRERSLRYVDQLEAHIDEGGSTTTGNIRDLIQMVRELAGENGVPLSQIVGEKREFNGGDIPPT